ncbi:MAG: threonine synthase [Candidatus Sumerlaeia bacterium]
MNSETSTPFVKELACVRCERTYRERTGLYHCPECGVEGVLDVVFDYGAIGRVLTRQSLSADRSTTHWRYRPLIPLPADCRLPSLAVGGTPVYRRPELAAALGLGELWIKDDGLNPTGSLKDRASSVAVARALAENAAVATTSSTGNAASSLAGNAASAGLRSVIFVPRHAPQGKVAQLRIFGSDVFVVEGRYEDAFTLSMKCVEEFGWYNRNCAINPYLVEGKKTVSLELCEQLQWSPPDFVFYAVGDGCSVYATWKGFWECRELGLTSRVPRIIGVQAEGAAPIWRAWRDKRDVQSEEPATLADSIAVGTPRNWRKAIRAVTASDGWFMTVSDDEILNAMRRLGRETGVFGEPAGVAGFAGLLKAVRECALPRGATVAVIVSGNGLKDIVSALKAAGDAPRVPPDFNAVREQLAALNEQADR